MMQIKIFTIPIPGGETLTEDMNKFLRSKKIIHVSKEVINSHEGIFWTFCIKYFDQAPEVQKGNARPKIDYKEVLDEESFARFSVMKDIRLDMARAEDVPAYAIFSDREMAELAKVEKLDVPAMKKIKGIGKKKIEKYGERFVKMLENE